MIQIGIDTSVLVGLFDPKDVWHGPAMALQQAFKRHGVHVAVFDCVLAEAISTMARRIREQRRSADLDQLLVQIANDYRQEDILWVSPDIPPLSGIFNHRRRILRRARAWYRGRPAVTSDSGFVAAHC